ncbi:MAG: BMC domain-containing protein [Myxococcales bacterium]|nr:BMC domain-containing protein [Myxococcales bacterium]MDP3499353.1 BMC domain-containing protein [Myxococcales bacterium]
MPIDLPGPALGLFELESLARGPVVADAILKQARVRIAIAEAVSPGKYLLVFSGEVGELEESFKAGLEAGGSRVLDSLLLPHIAEGVIRALDGVFATVGPDDAVGLVELHTVAATLKAADAALKKANVRLTALQLARGIGGKGWFSVAGVQHDVEAALDGAAAAVEPTLLVATELIQRPHADLRGRVV